MGIDLARGLAILGMFVVHVGLGWTLAGGENALYGVVTGRAAALFAVLAGVSMALLSGGSRPKQGDAERGVALWRIVLRGLLILPVGVGLTLLGTGVAVILAYYAVFFVVAVMFLAERWRVVAGVAVVLGVVGPLVSFWARGVLAGDGVAASVVSGVNAFDPLVRLSGEGVVDFLLTGTYPVLTWLPFVLVGLAVGRLDLWSVRVRWALVGIGAGAAVLAYSLSWLLLRRDGVLERLAGSENPESEAEFGAAGVSRALYEGFTGTVPVSEWRWLLVAAPHSGTPFEVFGAGGVAVAVLGVCLLAGRFLRVVGYPLAAVGACALTVYVGHIVVIWVTDHGWLAGTPLWWVEQEVALSVLVGSVVFATVWRLVVGRGPLEWPLHVVSSWGARRIP